MTRHLVRAAVAALLAASAAPAPAEEIHRPITAGADVDLVPIGETLATSDSGFGGALWIGRWKHRLRLTTTLEHEPESPKKIESPPGSGLFVESARRYAAVHVALSYDRFLRTEFRGPWAGAGLEVGWVTVGSDSRLTSASQTTPGAALALGWNVPVWRGLYVVPSASLHGALTRATDLEGARHRPRRVWAFLSLSAGWAERTQSR